MQKRLTNWSVLAGGAIISVLIARMLVSSGAVMPLVIVGGFFALVLVIKLGDKAWLLIPASLMLETNLIPVGIRSIENAEAVIPLVFLVYLLRVPLRKDRCSLFRVSNTGVLLYLGWALLVFAMNPAGLKILGAENVGLRAYFKLLLGFVSFIIISNQNIGEKECRRLTWIILGMSAVNFFFAVRKNLAFYGSEGFFTWHQALASPAYYFALFIFARFTIRELFTSKGSKYLLLYGLCVLLTLYSGKRMGVITILALPVIAAFLQRKYRMVLSMGACAILFVGILSFGHGHVFHLPKNVQRALAFAPGMWDRDVERTTTGVFRKKLRQYAAEEVRKDYLFGRKGISYQMDEAWALEDSMAGFRRMVAISALGSSWHNTWLGIAADFGIPAAVWWLIFIMQWLYFAWLTSRISPENSWQRTLCLMLLLFVITDVLASWTSGHSAFMAYKRWWMYGVVISIYRFWQHGIQNDEKSERLAHS